MRSSINIIHVIGQNLSFTKPLLCYYSFLNTYDALQSRRFNPSSGQLVIIMLLYDARGSQIHALLRKALQSWSLPVKIDILHSWTSVLICISFPFQIQVSIYLYILLSWLTFCMLTFLNLSTLFSFVKHTYKTQTLLNSYHSEYLRHSMADLILSLQFMGCVKNKTA